MTDTTRTRKTDGRLERTRDGRILAGVASGLSEHLGINAWWFRFAFIILAFFGGFGVLVYIAAWLVIPDKGYKDPVIAQWLTNLDMSDGGTIFGVVLVGAAGLIVLTQLADFSGTLIVASVLFVAGFLLYRGDLTSPKKSIDDEQALASTAVSDSDPTPPPAVAGALVVTEEMPPAPPSAEPPAPTEPAVPPPPKPPKERSVLGRITIAAMLIVMATMALVDLAFDSIDTEPIHYFATAVAIVGIGLVVGAFVGRALWLIIVGVLLLPVMWLSTLAPSTWDFSAGEFLYEPTTVADVETDIDHGVGQVVIDLTGLSAIELAAVEEIDVELGAGEVVIRLPEDVGFTLNAEVGLGEITGPFESRTGVGLEINNESFGSPPSILTLNLELGAGVITISDQGEPWNAIGQSVLIEGSAS
ncbi:MAG: PspC domain-containing protein [Acidimicrobiia bacterium]